jgi:glucokinase
LLGEAAHGVTDGETDWQPERRQQMSDSENGEPYYVGIDVGGTNVKVGIVDDSGHSHATASVPTEAERNFDVGLANIERAVQLALAKTAFSLDGARAIGLATPGPMDLPSGMLLDPANLPGWHDIPIRQRVSERFSKPTVLQNDANAAAYGEFWMGAARNAHSLVFWTLGTGIGCGIIIGDSIVTGEHSHGSECGHVIIEMDGGRRCDTGQYGTLEAYASAKSLVRRCREALDAGRASSLSARIADKQKLTPLLIAEAAEAGDELADELIIETARFLGIGTTTVMHTIDPAMVLFGGAMTFGRNETAVGRRFLQRIKDEVQTRAFPVSAAKTVIDYASLGSTAGYIGAAGCARLKFGDAK